MSHDDYIPHNRRSRPIEPDPERKEILPRVWEIAGGDANRQAYIIRGHLLRVDSTDKLAVAELVRLYNLARQGVDVLRERPDLRLFRIDEHPY